MAANITTLKDTQGNILYPQTKTEGIFNNNNISLDVELHEIKNNIISIQISNFQPTNQSIGGLWFEIID